MRRRHAPPWCAAITAVATLALLAGCGGTHSNSTSSSGPTTPVSSSQSSPIQHVVIIMQENRTFDNLFHGFPNADSASSGMHNGTKVELQQIPLAETADLDHSHPGWWKAWHNGAMDGFAGSKDQPLYAYSYVNQSDIQPYWTMASKYTLADRMFQSNTGPSFPAYQYMIAGQSGNADEDPSSSVWGCDAPSSSTVTVVGPNGTDSPGVYPCFDYQTMADLLDAKGMSWRYYAPADTASGSFFTAFEAIKHVFNGNDWKNNVISPQTQVLTDVAAGKLAQVTWVTADWAHSDHPGTNSSEGPDWVASVVNAVGVSSFWNSTAIFILWDDWGGWYDHVSPTSIDAMGPGFRVPLIVVSPYAKHGYVSHQVYETASLLSYIEKNFGLPNLGQRDAKANDISDCFDYTQKPAAFTAIETRVPPQVLMAETPSVTNP